MIKVVVISVEELEALIERVVHKAVSAANLAKPINSLRPLSLRQLARNYGVGRRVAMEDIRSGRLPCSERRCQGGRIGIFISPMEAERLYGGMGRSTHKSD